MDQRLFNTFGKRVRILRQDLGLRQTDVVAELQRKKVNIGQSYLSTIESSDRLPSGEVVRALAEVLGTTTDYLLLLSDDPNPPVEEQDRAAGEMVGELGEIYADLTEDDRQALLRIARALRNSNEPRIIE